MRTGSVLLAAAQADALWSVGCGDAIEDAKQAINRYTSTAMVLGLSAMPAMISITEVWTAPVLTEQEVWETHFVLAVTLPQSH